MEKEGGIGRGACVFSRWNSPTKKRRRLLKTKEKPPPLQPPFVKERTWRLINTARPRDDRALALHKTIYPGRAKLSEGKKKKKKVIGELKKKNLKLP